MSKHTPGPWDLDTTGPIPSIRVGRVGYITVNCGSDNKANARLIMAAPKLLQALKEATRALVDLVDMADDEEDRDFLKECRAIIAEAEGNDE